MLESGTDPESYITEYTLVYQDTQLVEMFKVCGEAVLGKWRG